MADPLGDVGPMGTVSIEIAGFENLVSAIATVRNELPGDRGQVSSALAGVVLSTDSLTPVESVLGWADDEIRGLQRRLVLAKVIEASTPGSTARPSEFQVGAWIDGNWVELGLFINK